MTPFALGFRCGVLAVYLGWLVWLLYGAGHFAWLICDNWNTSAADDDPAAPNPRLFSAAFRVYQSGMAWSYVLQEWIEGGVHCPWLPWGPPVAEEST